MFGRSKIILGKKGHRRRKLGPLALKVRAVSIFLSVVLFVGWSTGWMANKRRVRQAQLDISRIVHAARLFRADYGRCPHNLEELVTPPEGAPYLRPLTDPWGQPYVLHCPSSIAPEDVDVQSLGPDGETTTEDNVKNYLVELNL
ncbi:MAG: type II secretion system protein GspG [Deltaproteobacteria bacterium]|nr:type II secretion system protein GspG [Deltaproteobacteria bacterium]